MRANLDVTHGLIMAEVVSVALAGKLGKQDAHKLVEEASKKAAKEKRHLREVLAEDKRVTAQLAPKEIEKLFDPLGYNGAADAFITRLLGSIKSGK
jgi:3-carboxy-cis,cis-muconate cycloisomerase